LFGFYSFVSNKTAKSKIAFAEPRVNDRAVGNAYLSAASFAGRSNPAEQDHRIDLMKKFPEQSGKQSGIGHSNPDSTNR